MEFTENEMVPNIGLFYHDKYYLFIFNNRCVFIILPTAVS